MNMKLIIPFLFVPPMNFISKRCSNGLLQLMEKGDIYKSFYKGWYCTHCETFVTEHDHELKQAPTCAQHAADETSKFLKKHIFLNFLLIKIDY